MEPQVAWSGNGNLKDQFAYTEFSLIAMFLRFSGIHISSSRRQSSSCAIVYTGIAASILITCFIFIMTEILFCGVTNYVDASVVAFNVFVLIISCILWIIVFRRKHLFVLLVEGLIDTHVSLSVISNSNLRRNVLAICCYICFMPILTSLPNLLAIQEESLQFYLHCYLYGFELPDFSYYGKVAMLLVFLTVENFVHFFFPNVVVVLIFFLCEYQHQAVVAYTKAWPRQLMDDMQNAKSGKMVELYSKLRKDFVRLRDLTSLPILLILTQKFLTLFFSLTVLLSNGTRRIFIEVIESTFFAANAIFALILIILSASKIQEEHRKIRELCLNASLKLREKSSDSECLWLLALLKSFVEREDMTMTAAGIVPLKRSLFLKLGASLVTYGVIIVQLDSTKKN
ncbi:hypothetical protein AVEN_15970-1 [Araneus ventricosus]|uniref:Gustatory receptor n=1 Tax=Araneus ventricosus TaxID=182803 RepID=A0A4Y2IE41_ARAVE|nr:hypothetical protein AVEN_15970-1 [Araneus ventricosus]